MYEVNHSLGKNSFTKTPNIAAPPMMEIKYDVSVFLPNTFPITVMVAAFVAGPAIRNTMAAPGESPFMSKTAAMGTDPVAHTYNGIDARSTMNMLRYSLPK